MTLGEFYERDYAFEYKNSLEMHKVRVAIQWKYRMNADPDSKEKQVPELHEIIHLWMLGDEPLEKVEEVEFVPIEQRKTAQQALEEFNF